MFIQILSSEPITRQTCSLCAGVIPCGCLRREYLNVPTLSGAPRLTASEPEVVVTETKLKRCPRCEASLPISEFGVCRARKDGLNLYCKICIREKVAAQRQAMRVWKATQRRRLAARDSISSSTTDRASLHPRPSSPDRKRALRSNALRMPKSFPPVVRVRLALEKHKRLTFDELRYYARLNEDELSDLLPELMLWTRDETDRVYSQNGRGPRIFFLKGNEPKEKPAPRPELEPRSFGVSNVYDQGDFSDQPLPKGIHKI